MNRRPEHLTAREEQILRCIQRWIEERGEGPSVRQLADGIGLSSTASVAYHLGNLEERGALVRNGRGWRTCRLERVLSRGQRVVRVRSLIQIIEARR
ncbi:LexA family protein [Streptomyces mirabilis]|uniref:LexA family protein n=1 Tax=Streptomyces mirabilis TaxID=68239 RepID=UPI00099F3167